MWQIIRFLNQIIHNLEIEVTTKYSSFDTLKIALFFIVD